MSRINLYLLGTPWIENDGVAIKVDTRKAVALMAYVAVAGKVHRRDTLAALLWPDVDQTRARAAFRRTLSTLNKALGGAGLLADRESVRLEEVVWVDLREFRTGIAECGNHGHKPLEVCSRCVEVLTVAVNYYQDDFMKGFTLRDSPDFDDWQFAQSEILKRELVHALERLVQGHRDQGEFQQAIEYVRRWIVVDPLDESAHRQLMDLYFHAGQQSAALRQYRVCLRILDQELGVPPLEETTQLYQAIRENRLSPVVVTPQRQTASSEGRGVQSGSPTLPPREFFGAGQGSVYPLVGRSVEWEALSQTYEAISADGFLMVVEGEAGIGKTRLAEEFLAEVKTRGAATVSARCYEGEANLAYAPLVDALRRIVEHGEEDGRRFDEISSEWIGEAARLLPELRAKYKVLADPPPLDSPGAQARFFEAISQVLLEACRGSVPGVLFIDDLQWADEASLDLLNYMVRRLRGRPQFIVATWRADQLPEGHRLRLMLAEAQRSEVAALLPLKRLNREAMTELVSNISDEGTSITSDFEERLFNETDGLPFFFVEYLKAITEPLETDWSMPTSVRELLLARLARVSQTGRQLLDTAAVIGRSFEYDTLRIASGRSDDETVVALEELLTLGLINEVGRTEPQDGLSFDFNHDQLRSLVYEEISLARRRLLHNRIADSLINHGIRGRRDADHASLIARHFHMAGQNATAAEYFETAGIHARSLFANAEAIAHFRLALQLDHEAIAGLHLAIGDLQVLQGEYSQAQENYEIAAANCDRSEEALIERKLGGLYHRRGEWQLAESHFQAALDSLVEGKESTEQARLYSDWSLTAYHRGDAGRAQDMTNQALNIAETIGDQRAQAEAHNILGILARGRHNFDEAVYQLELSLQAAEDLSDPSARVAALNNLALALGDKGEFRPAISFAETALNLCTDQGDRHREAAIHNNLSNLLHAASEELAAMEHLKQAVTIFAEIGVEATEMRPEIWKLVEW